MTNKIAPLRWRRDADGSYVARAHHAGPTYLIRRRMFRGASAGWRLTVDGRELLDGLGTKLRYAQRYAGDHAAEHRPAAS